jgi:protein KRI1
VGYPRVIEGVVRKPDDRRKRQRDAKKERLQVAEEERREEVKRLKNLKRREIEERWGCC